MRWSCRAIVLLCIATLPRSAGAAEVPLRATTAPVLPTPAVPTPGVPRFELRSEHFIFGMPRATDDRHQLRGKWGETVPGISVLVREGFVVGHYDRFKVPAWVTTHWTTEDYRASEAEPYNERKFTPDHELPIYARAETDYEYMTSKMQRGHMSRQQDNKAWGADNVLAGSRMSNIVPQSGTINGGIWGELEDEHRRVVANPATRIQSVWIISGPVFRRSVNEPADTPMMTVGNGVGVPWSSYKVIGWFDAQNRFNVRAYLVPQDSRAVSARQTLTPVDEIEALTGLNFFPELDDEIQRRLESARYQWPWR